MIVWRIANPRFQTLDGIGGLHVPGRWHHVGRPVVYLAEHAALALLEVRVHQNLSDRYLLNHVLLRVDVSEGIKIEKQDMEPINEEETKAYGSDWLASNRTALARVRSAVAPESFNYLLNPLHSEANKLKITETQPVVWDKRLFE